MRTSDQSKTKGLTQGVVCNKCSPNLSLFFHRQQSQCSLCCPDLFLNEHIASDILALSLSAEASGTALRFRSVSG